MKKAEYQSPIITIVTFVADDVVTTSSFVDIFVSEGEGDTLSW